MSKLRLLCSQDMYDVLMRMMMKMMLMMMLMIVVVVVMMLVAVGLMMMDRLTMDESSVIYDLCYVKSPIGFGSQSTRRA